MQINSIFLRSQAFVLVLCCQVLALPQTTTPPSHSTVPAQQQPARMHRQPLTSRQRRRLLMLTRLVRKFPSQSASRPGRSSRMRARVIRLVIALSPFWFWVWFRMMPGALEWLKRRLLTANQK